MRFLVDENLPVDVAQVLQDHCHSVTHVSRSEHRGATDSELARVATREQRLIVTRDLGFSALRSPRVPGVILVRVPDTFTRRQIRDLVAAFVASAPLDQVEGSVTVLSPGRVRMRKM